MTHASTEGVAKCLKPSIARFLMQKELDYLVGAMSNPKRPFANVVGGSKHFPSSKQGLTGGAFGLLGNGNIPVHEHHSAWNTSNLCEQLPSSSMPFRNSPSFVNGLRGRHFPQMMGFPRSPPHMLSSASPVPHHIGSAPAVNPSLWEKHAYSPETSSLHLSSLQSAGFLGSSPQLQSVDVSSRNVFSQIGGNCMDISTLQHFSERSYHFFPGRDPVFSLPKSFDSLNESARNLSQRRNEENPNNVDKKQFELDIDRMLQGEDKQTNIPNKYTSKMLLAAIDEQCQGTLDSTCQSISRC